VSLSTNVRTLQALSIRISHPSAPWTTSQKVVEIELIRKGVAERTASDDSEVAVRATAERDAALLEAVWTADRGADAERTFRARETERVLLTSADERRGETGEGEGGDKED
jgi:hypothetical protein